MKHDECTIRRARIEDVPTLVALVVDDPLGQERENADLAAYDAASTRTVVSSSLSETTRRPRHQGRGDGASS